MAKIKTHITVGEIKAKALVFSDGHSGRWVVCAERMSYDDFHKRFASDYKDGLNWKQATGCLDSFTEYGDWYAIGVSDCFDPPIAIVRADNAGEAINIFVDELDWAHISDVDLEDYRVASDESAINAALSEGRPAPTTEDYSENVSFNSNGQAYNAEGIVCWEVKLARVECE